MQEYGGDEKDLQDKVLNLFEGRSVAFTQRTLQELIDRLPRLAILPPKVQRDIFSSSARCEDIH